MASAAQSPNCCCERCSNQPKGGNIKSAMEFRIKTVPSETAVSSWSACMIGATAAIALPPQIAVPTVIRVDAVLFTPRYRPASNPAANANPMLAAVYTNPLRPARNTSCRFITNPSPTTDACSKYFVAVRASSCHGCVNPNPKISPSAKATAGDTNPLAHNPNPSKNKIFTATKISQPPPATSKKNPPAVQALQH